MITLGPTGHVDTFARDHLPPFDEWPDLLLDSFDYPEHMNAAVELTDRRQPVGENLLRRRALQPAVSRQPAQRPLRELDGSPAVSVVEREPRPAELRADRLTGTVEQIGGLLRATLAATELRELRPFDVYRGEGIGDGKKSIAFHAVFQSPERTLSDDDARGLRERIVAALGERFGAELRA